MNGGSFLLGTPTVGADFKGLMERGGKNFPLKHVGQKIGTTRIEPLISEPMTKWQWAKPSTINPIHSKEAPSLGGRHSTEVAFALLIQLAQV